MNPNNSLADQASTLEDLLSQRFSCRAFKPDPLPRSRIEAILSLAQRTASWCNSQPWQVLITTGDATERFRETMLAPAAEGEPGPDFEFPTAYVGVYQERRRACGSQLYTAVGVPRGDRDAAARQARENFRLFGAPHVAIVTTDRSLGIYGAIDCGAYVSNFMLAAKSLGVASIAQAALATRPQRLRELFGLPPDRMIVCGISFGWPEESHRANSFRTARADIDQVVSWAS